MLNLGGHAEHIRKHYLPLRLLPSRGGRAGSLIPSFAENMNPSSSPLTTMRLTQVRAESMALWPSSVLQVFLESPGCQVDPVDDYVQQTYISPHLAMVMQAMNMWITTVRGVGIRFKASPGLTNTVRNEPFACYHRVLVWTLFP